MQENVQKQAADNGKTGWLRGNLAWLIILCVSFAIITSYYHHYLYVSAPNMEALSLDHLAVVKGEASAPLQYRLAPYYIAQGIMYVAINLGAPNDSKTLITVYLWMRIIVMSVAYFALLSFLGIWFDLRRAVLGLCFTIAVNPLAEFQYYHQPGDPWNYLFFILGFIAIARRRDYWLWPLIFIAVPFRESIVLLIPAYFAARIGEERPGKVILWTIALIAAWLIPSAILRLVFGFLGNYVEHRLTIRDIPSILHYNLTRPEGFLVLFLYFNVLWLAIFSAWRNLPRVVRRMFVIVPIFLVIHLVYGRLVEGRLYTPLLPLFLIAGLTWFDMEKEKKNAG
jgi:hypothetical protein